VETPNGYLPRTFTIQRPESPIACGLALRLSAPRHLETPSPIDKLRPIWSSAPFLDMSASSNRDLFSLTGNICWSWLTGQVAYGHTQRSSVQTQHLSILTHVSGGRRIPQVVIRTKTTSAGPNPCIRWQEDIPMWLSVQRQHLLVLTHALGGRRIYPSDYPYKDKICWSWPSGGRWIYPSDYLYNDKICWSWPMRQAAGGYNRVIIHTKTTFADPDPCIRR